MEIEWRNFTKYERMFTQGSREKEIITDRSPKFGFWLKFDTIQYNIDGGSFYAEWISFTEQIWIAKQKINKFKQQQKKNPGVKRPSLSLARSALIIYRVLSFKCGKLKEEIYLSNVLYHLSHFHPIVCPEWPLGISRVGG